MAPDQSRRTSDDPLVFRQYNEDLGNRLNAGIPTEDFATFGKTVINAVAGAVAANGAAEDPQAYAEKVAHRFFPNILPYVVGTSAVNPRGLLRLAVLELISMLLQDDAHQLTARADAGFGEELLKCGFD